jgi:hypothetical protein
VTILLYTKYTYILKLHLNPATSEIEKLVVWGNKFCTPVSKKFAACELIHVLTPSINSSLLLKQAVPQIGKQVVAVQSEIRAVRWVVKQLPVEIL